MPAMNLQGMDIRMDREMFRQFSVVRGVVECETVFKEMKYSNNWSDVRNTE